MDKVEEFLEKFIIAQGVVIVLLAVLLIIAVSSFTVLPCFVIYILVKYRKDPRFKLSFFRK